MGVICRLPELEQGLIRVQCQVMSVAKQDGQDVFGVFSTIQASRSASGASTWVGQS